MATGELAQVTGHGDFRKSPMKMIYRKFPKTPSLPVTCHGFGGVALLCLNGCQDRTINTSYTHTMQSAASAIQITTITTPAIRLTGCPFLKISWACARQSVNTESGTN